MFPQQCSRGMCSLPFHPFFSHPQYPPVLNPNRPGAEMMQHKNDPRFAAALEMHPVLRGVVPVAVLVERSHPLG